MDNLLLGKKGEDAAELFLKRLGYRIVQRNFRARYAEIDIIAIDSDTLVFVEVKTRMGTSHGLPQEAVTFYKLSALTRAVYYYSMEHPELPHSFRIDVIAVFAFPDHRIEKIEHFKNITR